MERKSIPSNLIFIVLIIFGPLALTGCSSVDEPAQSAYNSLYTPTHPKFAKRAYNKPYEIKGQKYHPQSFYEYSEVGLASYYGGRDVFHGRKTSMGETFDKEILTAAHKTLPIPCVARVTNVDNGRSIKVKINDRGPFVEGRIIDVSEKTAKLLGFYNKGVAQVKVDVCLNDTIHLVKSTLDSKSSTVLAKSTKNKSKQTVLAMNGKGNKSKKAKGSKNQKEIVLAQNTVKEAPKKTKQAKKQLATQQTIFVQAGTYTKLASAQSLVDRIKGIDHSIPLKLQKNKSSQEGFRVLAGPFESNEKAQLILKKVSRAGAKGQVLVVSKKG